MHDSIFWVNHFKNNLTKKRIDWSEKPNIIESEREAILYSLQAWQLGETSDGAHLLMAANRYADKINDQNYVQAVQLFIQEEQKHGRNLGCYIDRIKEKRKTKDWGDSMFRRVRYFNRSMELWTIAVIIVESAAQVFYQALHDATHCTLLKSICRDIMIDEAHHIKFQNERMHIIFQNKSFYNKAFSIGGYAVFFFITIHAIWFGHHRAFKAGGIVKKEFMRLMYYKFFTSMRFIHSTSNLNSINTSVIA